VLIVQRQNVYGKSVYINNLSGTWNATVHVKLILIIRMLLCVVNCGFEPRSCRTNEYKIGICYFSTKHAIFKALISRSHGDVTEWNECLPLECCFYELALYIQLVICSSGFKEYLFKQSCVVVIVIFNFNKGVNSSKTKCLWEKCIY
jgi:hypothetical protein